MQWQWEFRIYNAEVDFRVIKIIAVFLRWQQLWNYLFGLLQSNYTCPLVRQRKNDCKLICSFQAAIVVEMASWIYYSSFICKQQCNVKLHNLTKPNWRSCKKFTYVMKPHNLIDPRVGVNHTFEIDISALPDVLWVQIRAQFERQNWYNCFEYRAQVKVCYFYQIVYKILNTLHAHTHTTCFHNITALVSAEFYVNGYLPQ